MLPTVSSINKAKENEAIEDGFDLDDPLAKYKVGRPMFKLYTFTEDAIMKDPRLVVENVLRERGLLQGSTYAVDQILKQFKPPMKPRPDQFSQLGYISEEV